MQMLLKFGSNVNFKLSTNVDRGFRTSLETVGKEGGNNMIRDYPQVKSHVIIHNIKHNKEGGNLLCRGKGKTV